jgi:hypothetical protein
MALTEKQAIAYGALKLDEISMKYQIEGLKKAAGDKEPEFSLDHKRLAYMLENLRKAVLEYFGVHFMNHEEIDEFINDSQDN